MAAVGHQARNALVARCLEEVSVTGITDERLVANASDAVPAVRLTDWNVCPVPQTRHSNLAHMTGPCRH